MPQARLIFADPPYNIGIDYGAGSQPDKLPQAQYLAWCARWMQACADRLTNDGSLWVLIDNKHADYFGVMLRQTGLHRQHWIIWYETFGNNCRNGAIPRLCGTHKERIPSFPTQLPLALLRPVIGCASNPGDVVIDPFCGSATTGVAATELGRSFIGIEKEARFVELARQRLTRVTAQPKCA